MLGASLLYQALTIPRPTKGKKRYFVTNLSASGTQIQVLLPSAVCARAETEFGKAEQKLYFLIKEWRRVRLCSNGTFSPAGKEPYVFIV